MKDSKLYIAVRDDVPDYIVPTLVAHTILNASTTFENNKEWQEWKELSFKKCVVRVNEKEWAKICSLDNVFLGYEKHTLDGAMTCAVVLPCPNDQLPNVLKFAKLWSPKQPVA